MAANISQAGSVADGGVKQITPAENRKYRAAFAIVMMSMAMPFLTLLNVRYILAGGYVSPEANQVIGLIAALLMIISAGTIGSAVKAYKQGNAAKVQRNIFWTFGLGLVSFVLIGFQMVNHSVDIVTHYGETFVTTLGAVDVYVLIGLIVLLALRSRVIRLWGAADHSWGMQSNAMFWRFVVVVWLVMYVQLYLL